MSQKTLSAILKVGSILTLGSFFVITNSLYFPFITGKQLTFNILVEILLWFWFYLIIKYPASRPKSSIITYSLLAWLLVLLASSIFGIDFNLSFWGDTERMLGWFSLVHFFALYAIIITVFRSKTDWFWLLSSSVLTAVGLAVYALVSPDRQGVGNVNMASNISTLGNATYVAGVMLFNLYFIVYLWSNTRNYQLKFWYIVAWFFVFWSFLYANVSGSEAALIASLLAFVLVIACLHKNRRVRLTNRFGLIGVVAIIALLLAFRQAPIFDNNKFGSALREFSDKSTSLNARTFAWQAGWRGFLERPILGFGLGNFAAPFDKYFKAGLYKYTPNEEYYDRAHNMPIEMLATAGLLGFLTYLGLFVAVGISLAKAYRHLGLKVLTLATVVAIFVAYFVHNLAVFDSMANFVCFMIALAFVFWLSNRPPAEETTVAPSDTSLIRTLSLVVVAVALGLLIYFGSIRPMLMLRSAVKTAQAWYSGNTPAFLDGYVKTLAYRTPLDRDIRSLFVSAVLGSPRKLADLSSQEISNFLNSLTAASQANIAYNPNDYFISIYHAQLLQLSALVSQDGRLMDQALATINRAIANGGEHSPAYWTKSDILLAMKQYNDAAQTLRQALATRPDYPKAFCRLAFIELNYETKTNQTDIWQNLDNCLDKGDIGALGKGDYIKKAIKHYEDTKDQTKLIQLRSAVLTK